MNFDRDFAWEQAGFGPVSPPRPPPLTVHALAGGWTLCGLSPWEGWPKGHAWVEAGSIFLRSPLLNGGRDVRCPTCLRMALEKRPPGDTPPKEP